MINTPIIPEEKFQSAAQKDVQIAVPQELHLLQHPFYQAWMRGELTLKTLQDYAQQYYHHVKAFPQYLEKSLLHAQPNETREILLDNLKEENGEKFGTSHPELWLQFAEGLSVSRESVQNAKLRSGIQNVVTEFSEMTEKSFEDALGCLFAYESQVPEVAESKIEGLKKNYGIQDEKTLAFFEIHKTADIAHRESLLTVINSLSQEQKNRVQKAVNKSALALWNFLSEIYQTHGLQYAKSI